MRLIEHLWYTDIFMHAVLSTYLVCQLLHECPSWCAVISICEDVHKGSPQRQAQLQALCVRLIECEIGQQTQ